MWDWGEEYRSVCVHKCMCLPALVHVYVCGCACMHVSSLLVM